VQTDFVEYGGVNRAKAIQIASSLAARSDHPVSKTIANAAKEADVHFLDVTDFEAVPGQGTRGVIDGKIWNFGNHRMVEELGKCEPAVEKELDRLEIEGKSIVVLVGSDGVAGIFAVADTVKDSSKEAIQDLRKLGVKTMILTGDNEQTAKIIASQIGVDAVRGNMLPKHKLTEVETLSKSGQVGMVGDGINDAPALAKADIGFAMGAAGTDTAIETADVALMDDDLRKIPFFIKLSKTAFNVVAQNIALALVTKLAFLVLTLFDVTTMWMAVFADVGTSIIVVLNGLRLLRK
jgi:Cd2+/Zn2+-exporting ATPase